MSATVVGLAGVMTFHTKPAGNALGTLPVSGSTSPGSSSTTTPTTSPTTSPGVPATTTPTTAPSTRARSATGVLVNYSYGVLSVAVKATGSHITSVTIASLDDGGNFRSQSIDQQSLPILQQQALQAQSANIQGVSGASYTSAGFAQSLQSALSKLGIH